MTTRQFLLTYDDEEHSEIHHFLNSLPDRKKSKHVRIAILSYLRNNSNQESYIPATAKTQKSNKKDKAKKKDDDQLLEVPDSILNIGK